MLSTTQPNDQTAKGTYRLAIDAATGRCQVDGLLASLSLNLNHLRGGHPMIACHRNLPSGAIEGLRVCLLCGAELGLPTAREAAAFELLSEPGVAPVSLWPVKYDADTRTRLRLSSVHGRAKRRHNLAWLVWIGAAVMALFAPSPLTFHSSIAELTVSTSLLLLPVEIGGFVAYLYFGRRANRAAAAYTAELKSQTVKVEAQTAAIKAETRRVRAVTRKAQHARAKHLRYLAPRRTASAKIAA